MPNPTSFDIIALGHTTREMLAWVDRYPDARDGIFAERVLWTGGGMTGNLAHAVARLGGKVALACAVGDDSVGDEIVAQLAEVGVDTRYLLRRANTASQITILMVRPDLERAGLVTDVPRALQIKSEEIPDDLLQSGRVFFTDMEPATAAIPVAQRAKALGVPVAYDLQLAPEHINLAGHGEHINQMYDLCDFFFADSENFLLWRGTSALDPTIDAVLAERPELIMLITEGAAGSVLAWGDHRLRIPAFKIEPIVDTIGAGDAYHGAFLYTHLALGWPLEQAARFGAATAALSCTQPGGREGLPTRGEVAAFLRERET